MNSSSSFLIRSWSAMALFLFGWLSFFSTFFLHIIHSLLLFFDLTLDFLVHSLVLLANLLLALLYIAVKRDFSRCVCKDRCMAQNLKRDDVGSDLCEQSLIGVHGILSAQTTVGIIGDVAVALMEVFFFQLVRPLIDSGTDTGCLQSRQVVGDTDIKCDNLQ